MDNESRQRADEIVAQIKELVKKGNIARILVKRGEDKTELLFRKLRFVHLNPCGCAP